MWEIDVVDLYIPLTLSKKEMKNLGVKVDFVEGNIEVLVIKGPLRTPARGQPVVELLQQMEEVDRGQLLLL